MNRSSSAQGATEKTASPFAFGVRLDQADAFDRLAQTIAAHGDVIAVGSAAQWDPRTLPALGAAIHEAALALRSILDQVALQTL